MKQFSLLVRVPVTYTTEQAIAVGPQWNELLDTWKAEDVYIISFAFPGESFTVTGAEKTIKKEIVLSNDLKAVSNLVIQAEDITQAIERAKQCPILVHGGSVEVREIPRPVVLSK